MDPFIVLPLWLLAASVGAGLGTACVDAARQCRFERENPNCHETREQRAAKYERVRREIPFRASGITAAALLCDDIAIERRIRSYDEPTDQDELIRIKREARLRGEHIVG